MTNEKLGVLLVDVPEPRFWCYTYIRKVGEQWSTGRCNSIDDKKDYIFKCTKEEAKQYQQFRWVALEDLE